MAVTVGRSPRRNARPTWACRTNADRRRAADVYATLERAHAALASSRYPKLLFAGNPGALVSPPLPRVCRRPARLRGRPARRGRSLSPRRSSGDDRPIHRGWITRIEGAQRDGKQHESCAPAIIRAGPSVIGGNREMSAPVSARKVIPTRPRSFSGAMEASPPPTRTGRCCI